MAKGTKKSSSSKGPGTPKMGNSFATSKAKPAPIKKSAIGKVV